MPDDHDISINLHVWKKRENDYLVDLFTISHERAPRQTAICIDLPLPRALDALRDHLDTL